MFRHLSKDEDLEHVILWWTPFTLDGGKILQCGQVKCFVTNSREALQKPNLKAVLFYGSQMNVSDVPQPRNGFSWGLLHEESPRNNLILIQPPVLSLFNYTATFSRYSDVPLTLQYLPSVQALTDKRFLIPIEEKIRSYNGLAHVFYIQSDCDTPLDRDSYVKELMKYVKVDSYGQCLKNKELPLSLKNSLKTMMSEELYKYLAPYKFSLTIENAVCHDYISEKLWKSLMIGVVPIYAGSPTVKDWLPNNKSAILISEYDSPKDLSIYLNKLISDPKLYNEYLSHKIFGTIENKALTGTKYHSSVRYYVDKLQMVEDFECYVCSKAHENEKEMKFASKEVYNCPQPVSLVTRQTNHSNWWHKEWDIQKCQAHVAKESITNGQQFLIESTKNKCYTSL